MIALDASVLIGHLYPFDAHHEAATGLLLDADPGSLLVHAVTLAEVLVGGVRIGRGPQMRADLSAAGIALARRDDDDPLRLAELRTTTGLRLPDCCVLDAAIANAAALATFDGALAAAARGLGILTLPEV
jgi:predicted nucleic acid-binding protein